MRRLSSLLAIALCAGAVPAFADPHAEMAAALAAQIDAHPARAQLPTSRVQTASTQVGRGAVATPASKEHGSSQSNASPTGLAHQAQAATANAAGQAQAAAAKARPHPPHPTH